MKPKGSELTPHLIVIITISRSPCLYSFLNFLLQSPFYNHLWTRPYCPEEIPEAPELKELSHSCTASERQENFNPGSRSSSAKSSQFHHAHNPVNINCDHETLSGLCVSSQYPESRQLMMLSSRRPGSSKAKN